MNDCDMPHGSTARPFARSRKQGDDTQRGVCRPPGKPRTNGNPCAPWGLGREQKKTVVRTIYSAGSTRAQTLLGCHANLRWCMVSSQPVTFLGPHHHNTLVTLTHHCCQGSAERGHRSPSSCVRSFSGRTWGSGSGTGSSKGGFVTCSQDDNDGGRSGHGSGRRKGRKRWIFCLKKEATETGVSTRIECFRRQPRDRSATQHTAPGGARTKLGDVQEHECKECTNGYPAGALAVAQGWRL